MTLLAGVVLLFGTPIAALWLSAWWSDARFRRDSPIAALSLRGTDESTEREFRRRVQAALPIGTAVDDMRTSLSAQGFRARADQSRPDSALVLEVSTNLACDNVWKVFFTGSATGLLTGVDADVTHRCS